MNEITTTEEQTSGAVTVEPSEKELDKVLSKIAALKVDMTRSGWKIGREVAGLMQRQLWRARRGENASGTKYDTFGEFCDAELGMTMRHAQRLAAISTKFSEKEFQEGGPKKLAMLLEENFESPEERRRVLEIAANSSARALEHARDTGVLRGLANAPTPSPSSSTSAPPATGALPLPPPPQQVALALIVDKITKVAFLARESNKSEDVSPAKIADLKGGKKITARMEINKRTALWFTLRESATGQLELLMKPVPIAREGK